MNFFELPMGTALKNYSTGQQNQFEVILALCQGADYILMDEPFAGNDVFNREDLKCCWEFWSRRRLFFSPLI